MIYFCGAVVGPIVVFLMLMVLFRLKKPGKIVKPLDSVFRGQRG